MERLEYIDDYFKGEVVPEKKNEFEKRILDDPEFADEVAFYLISMHTAKEISSEERNKRFREIYMQIPLVKPPSVQKIWLRFAVAATIAGILIAGYFFLRPTPPSQLADQFINKELTKLGVKMSGEQDSLQNGLRFYNEGKYDEALILFESIVRRNPSNFDATKNAGIVSLRLEKFDNAFHYFETLEKFTDYYSNPAKFYQALTLLKRNTGNDVIRARQLLLEVVENDLEGKPEADKLLKKL